MNDVKSQCPACGAEINRGDNRCNYCNSEFKSQVTSGKVDLKSRACPHCKYNSDSNEEFCQSCGDNLKFKCPHCFAEKFIITKYCNDCGKDISNLSQDLISKNYVGIASFAETLSDNNIDTCISVFNEGYNSKSFNSNDANSVIFLLKYAQALNKKYTKLLNSSSGSLLGSTYSKKEKLVKIILNSTSDQSIKEQAECLLIKREGDVNEKSCFIATATMGDNNHPVVIELRIFRDRFLMNHRFGKFIIKIYYKLGPYFAKVIERNIYMRKFSFNFIVNPIHKLSRFIDKEYINLD